MHQIDVIIEGLRERARRSKSSALLDDAVAALEKIAPTERAVEREKARADAAERLLGEVAEFAEASTYGITSGPTRRAGAEVYAEALRRWIVMAREETQHTDRLRRALRALYDLYPDARKTIEAIATVEGFEIKEDDPR